MRTPSLRIRRGLAVRVALVSVSVALLAIGVIAAGVLVVAQSTFDRLMIEAGTPAVEAQAMFDRGVATIFIAAVVVAAVISVVLSVVLADRLTRPLQHMAAAARRIAAGDYETRVDQDGASELASLAGSFNQMAGALAEQERARREFIVNAAHELRTPLTNLQGYLEALRDGVIAPTAVQFESLHQEAQRLVRLSRALDALADDQPVDGAPAPGTIDLSRAVRSAFEVTRPAFDAKSIRVELRVPERITVRAEPDGLAQVLGNLLQNALRYTPAGGAAAIRAERARSQVIVSIANTGDGIPAGDLPHVFDRFYRVEKSRDAARGGAGIGLAIVKQLVERAGGEVGADSSHGITRVWFALPAA